MEGVDGCKNAQELISGYRSSSIGVNEMFLDRLACVEVFVKVFVKVFARNVRLWNIYGVGTSISLEIV